MDEIDTELVILWILTGAAVLIMLLRIFLRLYRKQRLHLGDYLTIAAIFSLLIRGAVIHVALVWGTNQMTAAARKAIQNKPQQIYRAEIGSKLTIVNRVFYCIYVWLQKCIVMCVIQHLLQGLQSTLIVRLYWAGLAATFVAAFVVDFTDCRPFVLYWQVIPDPGTCAKGIIQLIVFSSLNMFTDVMLIALPLPHLVKVKRPFMAKLRLIILFLVGLTIVTVTLLRVLMNLVLLNRTGPSHDVANVELFFSAFVANAPTIYGLLRIEGRNQSQYAAKGSYPSGSWTGSKSAKSEVHVVSRPIESNRQRSGNESEEEMMIELPDSSSSLHVHKPTSIASLA